MPCHAILHYSYYSTLFHAIPCCSVLFHAFPRYSMIFHAILRYSKFLHAIPHCYSTLFNVIHKQTQHHYFVSKHKFPYLAFLVHSDLGAGIWLRCPDTRSLVPAWCPSPGAHWRPTSGAHCCPWSSGSAHRLHCPASARWCPSLGARWCPLVPEHQWQRPDAWT